MFYQRRQSYLQQSTIDIIYYKIDVHIGNWYFNNKKQPNIE